MPELTEHSIRYPGWRVAMASSACVFVSFASLLVYTFGIFLKPLAAEFSWSRQAISAAFGLAALAVAACSPPLGLLLDRYPARRIILPCLTCLWLGVRIAVTAHAPTVAPVRGLPGARHRRQRNRSPGLLSCDIDVVSGAPGRRLCGVDDRRSVGRNGTAPGRPVVDRRRGLAQRFRDTGCDGSSDRPAPCPTSPRASVSRALAKNAGRGASVGEGLRSRIFWIIATVLFLCSIAQNGSIAHLSALLTDRGISPANAALAASAMGGAALAGRLFTGWLLDRFFAPRVSFCLLAIAALGTFLLSGARSMLTGVAGAAYIGFGMGGEADVTPYLLSKYFGLGRSRPCMGLPGLPTS